LIAQVVFGHDDGLAARRESVESGGHVERGLFGLALYVVGRTVRAALRLLRGDLLGRVIKIVGRRDLGRVLREIIGRLDAEFGQVAVGVRGLVDLILELSVDGRILACAGLIEVCNLRCQGGLLGQNDRRVRQREANRRDRVERCGCIAALPSSTSRASPP